MKHPIMTTLARRIAGAPKAGTIYQAPLSPRFSRGLVSGYNADGSLLISLDGSPSAINADALNGLCPPIGAPVELHTFGTRLVVDGVLNGAIAYARCNVYRNGALTATSGSPQIMPFDTAPADDAQDGTHGWSGSPDYQFVAPLPGQYDVFSALSLSATTGRLFLSLYLNGSEAYRGADGNNGTSASRGATLATSLYLNQGDFIDLRYFSGSAVGFNVGSGATCYLRIVKRY